MLRRSICMAAIVVVSATQASADPSISLSSPRPSLAAIILGDTFTVNVELDALAGEQLDFLAATVVYDGALLGTPDISMGGILPAPLSDPLDVVQTADEGFADVAFLTLATSPTQHVTENGLFYSFDVTAVRPGQGTISIDFAGATQFNSTVPDAPIPLTTSMGQPLEFEVFAFETDFNNDGEVDGQDFLVWQVNFGITSGATIAEGDADGDGDVDGDDFLIWQTQFGESAARLQTDFNNDGSVNGADFLIWQTNFGTTVGATQDSGDADGDGDVDGQDFLIWQTQFGASSGAGSHAIPEPSSWLILFVMSLVSVRRRGTDSQSRR